MRLNLIIFLLLVNVAFSQEEKPEIAFVGNSITNLGYYLNIVPLMPEYYLYKLAVQGVTVANSNNQYRNTTEFQTAINKRPEFIVMLLGTNDYPEYFSQSSDWRDDWESEYRYLVNEFKKNSTVLIGLIPYRINNSDANTAISMMNGSLYGVAYSYGLQIVDFNSALRKNPDYYMSDGYHPNEDGNKRLAETARIALEILIRRMLSIEDEYWNAAEDYEMQKKVGWFGCQP